MNASLIVRLPAKHVGVDPEGKAMSGLKARVAALIGYQMLLLLWRDLKGTSKKHHSG